MCALKHYVVLISVIPFCSPSKISTGDDAVHYLAKFGYLKPMAQVPPEASIYQFYFGNHQAILSEAVLNFQKFAGLKSTGTLDTETMKKMNTPRCGNPDMKPRIQIHKRFSVSEFRWTKEALIYRIMEYPKPTRIFGWLSQRFTAKHVESELRIAFSFWAQASGLRFASVTSGKVDIEIRFAEKIHGGDNDRNFDGPGTEIAHAFLPDPTHPLHGDIHFDNEEPWVTGDLIPGTFHFRWAAVHEIGHALGLQHSSEYTSYMFPMYPFDYSPRWLLHEDDILGIRALYPNLNVSNMNVVPSVTPTTKLPDLDTSSSDFNTNQVLPVQVNKFNFNVFVGGKMPRFSYLNPNYAYHKNAIYPQFVCRQVGRGRSLNNRRRYFRHRHQHHHWWDKNAIRTSKHICIPFEYILK